MTPTLGVRVFFQLDEETAQRINRLVSEHGGTPVLTGTLVAGHVTRVWSNTRVNIKVQCDAPFDLWVQNVPEWNGVPGQGLRTWRWPIE
jgi:hypothetical protein